MQELDLNELSLIKVMSQVLITTTAAKLQRSRAITFIELRFFMVCAILFSVILSLHNNKRQVGSA